MICTHCQDERERNWDRWYGPKRLSFADWTIHMIVHAGDRWGVPFAQFLVLHAGVLDAEEEGGVMFWRWDFWNAKERARYRRFKGQPA